MFIYFTIPYPDFLSLTKPDCHVYVALASISGAVDQLGNETATSDSLSHIYKPTYATMQIKSHKLSFKFKMAFK